MDSLESHSLRFLLYVWVPVSFHFVFVDFERIMFPICRFCIFLLSFFQYVLIMLILVLLIFTCFIKKICKILLKSTFSYKFSLLQIDRELSKFIS